MGKRWKSHDAKSGLYGQWGKVVRSSFTIASWVAHKLRGLPLTWYNKIFFLYFQILLTFIFQKFEYCSELLWAHSGAKLKVLCVPKNSSHVFSCQTGILNFFFYRCSVVIIFHELMLHFWIIRISPCFIGCPDAMKKIIITFLLLAWQQLLANFNSWTSPIICNPSCPTFCYYIEIHW